MNEGDTRKAKKKAPRHAKAAPSSSISSHLDHNSQLLGAIAQGKPRLVRRLLDTRADPNYQGGPSMVPPLMLACDLRDEDSREIILDLLLSKGADANLKDASGKTALMKAVINDTPAVSKLLKHGADVSIVDRDGNVALNYAAEVGNTEHVRLLVKEGKKRRLDLDHQNLHGLTPLLLAAQEGHLDTARILAEGGASLSKRDLEHFMTAHDWMKLSGCFPAHQLEFLSPSGKRRNFYRQERRKKGIKTLADYLPTLDENGGTDSPNVFTVQQPDHNPFQFPILQTQANTSSSIYTRPIASAGVPMKSMFDIPTSKKQASLHNGLGINDKRRNSISFPSVSSVKTDLYKSSYLTRRKSLLLKNTLSEGYHSGALTPLAASTKPQATPPTNRQEVSSIKNSKLPPINLK